MVSDFLSNVELYYTPASRIKEGGLLIEGEESEHITRVMRHSLGDELYVTDGEGRIFLSEITGIEKSLVRARIHSERNYENRLKNIFFCMARLKSQDRFEFALEKSVELGVTNFIIFDSQRSIPKGGKVERWQKVLTSSMKQSLRSFLPKVSHLGSISEVMKLPGEKIVFEQDSKLSFRKFTPQENKNYYFVFGPEGGLDKKELSMFSEENSYFLTENRLRSETAVIMAAAVLSTDH
ncbi:MAG TPA: RsmE family RNA methyltransferase [Ignavibacteriales bacterium]|nr:RsmE family RNA methyltransferase [Ignavibacteriales bacterium]